MDLILDLLEPPLGWAFNKYVDTLGASLEFFADKLDDVSFRLAYAADDLRWAANAVGVTIP